MSRRSLIHVVAIALVALIGSAAASPSEYEGRWNLTEVEEGHSYASWLEVRKSDSGWSALLLSRSGHPMPAAVEIVEGSLRVTRLPEDGRPTPSDWKPLTLTGTISNGQLSGTGTKPSGQTFTWAGVRQPDRSEGTGREVSWGKSIQLFNGKDLAGWEKIGGGESHWKAVDGVLVNERSGANLRTAGEFRDFKLHLEFKIPPGSNSGIYLRGRYETQVADDYGKEPYSRGVGGIYGQIKPTVNASKAAGEWNIVDVTLVGYHVTIEVNGERTIDNVALPGITGGALDSDEGSPGPIYLQGDHGPVSYRNVVLTPAK